MLAFRQSGRVENAVGSGKNESRKKTTFVFLLLNKSYGIKQYQASACAAGITET